MPPTPEQAADARLADAIAALSPRSQRAADAFRKMLVAERAANRHRGEALAALMQCTDEETAAYEEFTLALVARYPEDS